MGKRNRWVTIVDTVVIHSQQLSKSEKLLYVTLKSYRNKFSPHRCNPAIPTILNASGLSKPTFIKAIRSLESKGLIKCERSGPGRTKTNQYIFPLLEGKEDEKQGLLAYLKVKKRVKN